MNNTLNNNNNLYINDKIIEKLINQNKELIIMNQKLSEQNIELSKINNELSKTNESIIASYHMVQDNFDRSSLRNTIKTCIMTLLICFTVIVLFFIGGWYYTLQDRTYVEGEYNTITNFNDDSMQQINNNLVNEGDEE